MACVLLVNYGRKTMGHGVLVHLSCTTSGHRPGTCSWAITSSPGHRLVGTLITTIPSAAGIRL